LANTSTSTIAPSSSNPKATKPTNQHTTSDHRLRSTSRDVVTDASGGRYPRTPANEEANLRARPDHDQHRHARRRQAEQGLA
jgi:hypothetical protein